MTTKKRPRLWQLGVVVAALFSTAAMPPISQQARAAPDRTLGVKGVYVQEESAHKFAFPRADISVRVAGQRLSPEQAPRSWATFSPSMHQEGFVAGGVIVLEDEANRVISAALNAGLDVTGMSRSIVMFGSNERAFVQAELIVNPDELQRVLKALRARDFTVTSIRKHTVNEHPESLFISVWKRGAALELARGLRFALDVAVGAAKVALNSGGKSSCDSSLLPE